MKASYHMYSLPVKFICAVCLNEVGAWNDLPSEGAIVPQGSFLAIKAQR